MADPQQSKAFPVSWDQFHRDSRALAWRLAGFDCAMPCLRLGMRRLVVIFRPRRDGRMRGEEESESQAG